MLFLFDYDYEYESDHDYECDCDYYDYVSLYFARGSSHGARGSSPHPKAP